MTWIVVYNFDPEPWSALVQIGADIVLISAPDRKKKKVSYFIEEDKRSNESIFISNGLIKLVMLKEDYGIN